MPKRNAIVQPLLLAVILALGLAVVWADPYRLGMRRRQTTISAPPHVYESLVLRMDGTPVVRKQYERY